MARHKAAPNIGVRHTNNIALFNVNREGLNVIVDEEASVEVAANNIEDGLNKNIKNKGGNGEVAIWCHDFCIYDVFGVRNN